MVAFLGAIIAETKQKYVNTHTEFSTQINNAATTAVMATTIPKPHDALAFSAGADVASERDAPALVGAAVEATKTTVGAAAAVVVFAVVIAAGAVVVVADAAVVVLLVVLVLGAVVVVVVAGSVAVGVGWVSVAKYALLTPCKTEM